MNRRNSTSIKTGFKINDSFSNHLTSNNKSIPNYNTEICFERGRADAVLASGWLEDQQKREISKDYLKKVSADLCFAEDVVKERAAHTLPYDPKYFYDTMDISDVLPLKQKCLIPFIRNVHAGFDKRHMPCSLTVHKKYASLKPLKKKTILKALKLHQASLKKSLKYSEKEYFKEESRIKVEAEKDEKPPVPDTDSSSKNTESIFLTELATREGEKESKKHTAVLPAASEKDFEWDAYLMSVLSKNTANWIVHRKMSPSEDKEQLASLLNSWHGKPEHTDLLRENMSDSDDSEISDSKVNTIEEKNRKWKEQGLFLEKVYGTENVPERSAGINDEENQKFSLFKRGHMEEAEREYADLVNPSAQNIKLIPYKTLPPPTMRDVMNPKLRSTVYDTSNSYELEWLRGTQQMYKKLGDRSYITMESCNQYQKQLQPAYPQEPDHWCQPEEPLEGKHRRPYLMKAEKGGRRWKDLPQPVSNAAEVLDSVFPDFYNDCASTRSPSSHIHCLTGLSDILMQIFEEWRTRWHLNGQFEYSNPDDLIHDMSDVQEYKRLRAIVSAGAAPRPSSDTSQDSEKEASHTGWPETVFTALNCLLQDPYVKVRKAAAVALYVQCHPTPAAEALMREILVSSDQIDRWTAALCLAYHGVCDSDVVAELIAQLISTNNAVKQERVITHLSKLSANSNLVHFMVAELFNSSNWCHRVIACKVMPHLHGPINKDITHKLTELMWNDWHSDVRKNAAQCLGKKKCGRDVHDDLRERIMNGPERVRLEAISKVGHLGIMTAKLLPVFLKCFDDSYVYIRSEACVTAGNLEIQDKQVIDKLIHLATNDPVWKVKALAVQALGQIQLKWDSILSLLLWAIRHEEHPAVRAEACHSLMALGFAESDVIDVLQERYLVESHPLVREEIIEALGSYGISTSEDMEMVAQIKNEVLKLSSSQVIASEIILQEKDKEKQENFARMIYETSEDLKRKAAVRPSHTQVRYNRMYNKDIIDSRVIHDEKFIPRSSDLEPPIERKSKYPSVINRIKTLSRTGTFNPSPTPAELYKARMISRMSSPVSRESTMLTSAADQELEILFAEGEASAGTSIGLRSSLGEEDYRDGLLPVALNTAHETAVAEKEFLEEHAENIITNMDILKETMEKQHMDKTQIPYKETDRDELKSSKTAMKSNSEVFQSGTSSDSFSDARDEVSDHYKVPQIEIASGTPGSRITLMPHSFDSGLKTFSALCRESAMEQEKVSTKAKATYFGLKQRYADLEVPHE